MSEDFETGTSDAADEWNPPAGRGADLSEVDVQALNEDGSLDLPWEEEHVHPGRLVSGDLIGTFQYFRITTNHRPTPRPHIAQPYRVGGSQRRLARPVKLGRRVNRVAQILQCPPQRLACEALVYVELRRRGPRGRGRRS